MSRPLRVPHEGLIEGDFHLSEAGLKYATRVHRLRTGDVLTLFDVSTGLEAEAELLDDRVGLVRVTACRSAGRAVLPITLLAALGKGDKPEQVVRDAATLGAARVVFVQAERSIARATGSDRGERFRRIAIETARQCGRSDVPSVEGPVSFAEALPRPPGSEALRLIACRAVGSRPLLAVVSAERARRGAFPELEILIGPEGGFSSSEIDAAVAQGFVPVGLGPLVLRTEVAAGAVLAALWLFDDAAREA